MEEQQVNFTSSMRKSSPAARAKSPSGGAKSPKLSSPKSPSVLKNPKIDKEDKLGKWDGSGDDKFLHLSSATLERKTAKRLNLLEDYLPSLEAEVGAKQIAEDAEQVAAKVKEQVGVALWALRVQPSTWLVITVYVLAAGGCVGQSGPYGGGTQPSDGDGGKKRFKRDHETC